MSDETLKMPLAELTASLVTEACNLWMQVTLQRWVPALAILSSKEKYKPHVKINRYTQGLGNYDIYFEMYPFFMESSSLGHIIPDHFEIYWHDFQ